MFNFSSPALSTNFISSVWETIECQVALMEEKNKSKFKIGKKRLKKRVERNKEKLKGKQ